MNLRRVLSNRLASWFLAGCFLSSLGSVTYIITLLAMSPVLGIPMWILGATLGAHRIVGFFVNSFWGHLSDIKSPRSVLLFTEFGGALGAACLALSSEPLKSGHYLPFILANIVRATFISLQASAFGKTTKQIDETLGANGRFAILANKANFGTIFFGMFLSLYFVSRGSLLLAIAFDFATFLGNGLIAVLVLQGRDADPKENTSKTSIKNNFTFYQKSNPDLYASDFILALVMFGANTLNARIYFLHPHLIPMASGAFGLAVWLAGPFDRFIHLNARILWLWLAIALIAQASIVDSPPLLVLTSVLRNLAYWILYNRISVKLTQTSRTLDFGQLTASRQAMTILIGSLGEWWVGATSALPLILEMGWRGLTATVFSLLALPRRKFATAAAITIILVSMDARAQMTGSISLPVTAGAAIELDPQKMENVASVFVDLQIHRGLMRFTPDLQVTGALAEKYEILDSGSRYRFHLRTAFFSDGTMLKADDVVSTFRRMFVSKAGMSADLDYVSGAKQLMEGKSAASGTFGVTAISDTEVEFKLSQANPLFLTHLAAVDSAIYKIRDNAIIGAGPYRVHSETHDLLILEWAKSYFQPPGNAPQEVRFVRVKDEYEATRLAREGKIDSLDNIAVPNSEMTELLNNGWHREVTHLARSIFLSIGLKHSLPTRLQLQASILNEYQPPTSFSYRKAFGVIPDALPGALSASHLSDLAQTAKVAKIPRSLTLLYLQSSTELAETAGSIQSILAKMGAHLRLEAISADRYFAVLKSGEYDLILRSKYLDYPDALSVLTYFDSRIGSNTFGINSPAIDKMLDRAKVLPSGQEKFELYRDIQIAALKQATIVPVAFGSNASGLWSKRVASVPNHPLGIHSLPIESIQLK